MILNPKIDEYAHPDSDILGSSKKPVDQNTHERGVETEFNRQIGQFSVGHTLRNNDATDSDTWKRSRSVFCSAYLTEVQTRHTSNQIPRKPLPVIPGDPGQEREQTIEVEPDFAPGGSHLLDPVHAGRFGFQIRVGVHGAVLKSRFATGDGVFTSIQRIPVGDLDPQSLC